MAKLKEEHYWRSISLFSENILPEKSELSLLKGHLLIEKSLNIIIRNHLKNDSYFDSIQLTFLQKLYLAKSILILSPEDSWVWSGIEKLNNIRNKLAHELIDSGKDDRLNSFISFAESNLVEPLQEDQVLAIGKLNMIIFHFYHIINSEIHSGTLHN